ncbi:MAG: class I SAM-dependent methyltransferase [Acidiferrobacterales bacterium]
MSNLSHSFGNEKVAPEERQRRIREMFGRIASRYDLMNDLMSLGIHRLWKRDLAWAVDPRAGQCVVDLAGGTGDVARLLTVPDCEVIVCDPSVPMMNKGRSRGEKTLGWLAGAGEALPFRNNAVDTLTIAFGLRNVTHVETTLREILRVLKPGGRLLCLEFSRPRPWLRGTYNTFSRLVIPRLGGWVARDPAAYHYLVESIRRFPDQREMKTLFKRAGFVEVYYKDLSFGIACIHIGTKPDHASAE